jgi:hypothetical protein
VRTGVSRRIGDGVFGTAASAIKDRAGPCPVACIASRCGTPRLTIFWIAVGHSGLPRPLKHWEHGALHGAGPRAVQGLLEGLAEGERWWDVKAERSGG